MSPYEPKTDSQEFDVASHGQEPAAWRDSTSDATGMAIRLWGPEWPGQPGSLTWKTDSVFVYMIADLVLASHGRLAEELTAGMAAHFDSSRHALVAAKRIQMSILDFVASRPGNGVAILIHQLSTQDANSGVVQGTLRLAKPGQILVGGDVSRRLRGVSGVDLFPVPALTAGTTGQTGLTELVWTTPERLANLQASVVDGAASVPESPPVGATMMVRTPIANTAIPSAEQEATISAGPPPAATTGDFVYRRSSDSALERTLTVQQPAADLAPSSDDRQGAETGSLTQELDDLKRRPLITRTRVILGVVALVLVGVLIAVLYLPRNETKSRIPPAENNETGAGSAVSKPPTVRSEPPPPQPQPQPKAPEPQAKVPKVVVPPATPAPATPQAEARAKTRKDNAAQVPQVVEEFGGLTQNDVPTLLRLGREDMGAGRYDKARSEFKKILQLQPGNQDAKDGLRRLDLIKSDSE